MIFGTIDTSAPHSASIPHALSGVRMEAESENDVAYTKGQHTVVCSGKPVFRDAATAQFAMEYGTGAAWLSLYEKRGIDCPAEVGGAFAVAVFDAGKQSLFLAVDRFSIHTLCYNTNGAGLSFAERADRVVELAGKSATLNRQSLFDYLYFHMIPSPRTVFSGVQRLQPGHFLLAEKGTIKVAPWWRPVFQESENRPFTVLQSEFHRLLREAIANEAAGIIGCFLSGGTDSSTVAGMVGEVTGKPARTFSIGFDAEGYDEMEYARIAARHFKTEHHEYYVAPDDLVRSIPEVAASYDQPFGNSSALPGYYCARVARENGIEKILAGDGGDELFGGNSRYAKQRVFGIYDGVPRSLRRGMLEPLLLGVAGVGRLPGVKKAASYVEQARVPMPDRLQMYNLLLRLGLNRVFEPEFLASVDLDEPLQMQRETYASCSAHSLINRMLAYDWKYTLADSDLPKVVGTTRLAGLAVGFPMLDDRLVDFSLRLKPEMKLKGLKLRWFFKEALRGFLPDAIISKKKHGFGLPFGVWAIRHAPLRSLALDSLNSLKHRRIVKPQFIDELMARRLAEYPGYYGEMVWILMMLEQWLQAKEPGYRA